MSNEKLKSYVERIERLEDEKKSLGQDISEVFKEAVNDGFDKKAMKQILKIRKLDESKLGIELNLVEIYKKELGMTPIEKLLL